MGIIQFLEEVGKLKSIKRTGWIKHHIPDPESVADHSFRVAVMSLVLAEKAGIDANKCVKMALVHDIGEAKVGDLIKFDAKGYLPGYEEKLLNESKAVEEITGLIGGKVYDSLFKEYSENKSKEARFVKQVDKLERALQALEYEKKVRIKLDEFFQSADMLVDIPILKEILLEIEKLR